jgi:D-3-phosphoglycerate dehydrogenase
MSPAAIAKLKAQSGWDLVVADPKTFEPHLADCEALLVRSGVKVTAAVLAQAPKLRVIGRAGVGVDNVDLNAATAAGVVVMNTPGGNAVSVAEHTFALMLALARMVPEANASTRSGKWEKKKFLGNEIRGKTLGIVGLGNIGQEVVRRARGFEMHVLASDPFVSAQTAQALGVELVPLDKLFAEADYVSLHLGLTSETRGMINAASIAKMKDGVRIINCARGELIDQAALTEAIKAKKVAGAGLDVFSPEPPPAGDPLLECENVIATPHIAGSTEEAQEIVGLRIVDQLAEYLNRGVAINAVNIPVVPADQYQALNPYLTLAERLGSFAAHIASGNPEAVKIVYSGRIAELNTALLRNAAVAGALNRWLTVRANLVNAMPLAAQRGLSLEEKHETRGGRLDSIGVEIRTTEGVTRVAGSVVLDRPRLMEVDGIPCEVNLSGRLLYLRNIDVPGVIGHVGTVLGRNGINIANFSLGREERAPGGKTPPGAVAIVEVDGPAPDSVLAQLLENPAVRLARVVEPSS